MLNDQGGRMGIGGRKDPRDRRRHQRNKRRKKGASARGLVGGRKRGKVVAVRDEKDESGRVTTEVTEEAFDLPVGNGLGKMLKTLRIKVNWVREIDGPWKGSECVRSFVLSLVFRKTVEGITGLPVGPTRQRKLRKIAYNRVSIEKVPEDRTLEGVLSIGTGYDERRWRINFWKEGRGKRQPGKRFSGRPVHTVIDELSVLEWIFNNGLMGLYESPYLTSNRDLPKTDEQRVHENTVSAGMKIAFGVNVGRCHSETHMHRTRQMTRLREVNDGDELVALNAFAETALGKKNIVEEMKLELPEQKFYFSQNLKCVFALFNFPTLRYIMRVDLNEDRVIIEPLRTDRKGRPLMKRYQNFLENTFFEEINWVAFRSLTMGTGRIKVVVD